MALDAGTAFLDVLPRTTQFGPRLESQINPQLTRTQARLGAFKAAAGVAFVAAGAAALKFAASSVEAYRQSEVATVALQNAISKSPALLGETTAAFQEQATALQNLTGVQDEEILAADTILARFKLTGDQIREVTPLVLDYAQAAGKDVPTAAEAVGKALLGNTRALKEIGIAYTMTGDSATDLANIQDLLKDKVGGAAEAFGGTNAGKVAIFSAKLDDLKESIGQALIPIIDGLVKGLSFLVDMFQGLPGPVKSTAIVVGVLGTAFVALGIALNVVRGALRGYVGDSAAAVVSTQALAVAEGEAAVAATASGVATGTATAGMVAATGAAVALAPAVAVVTGAVLAGAAAWYLYTHDGLSKAQLAAARWNAENKDTIIGVDGLEHHVTGVIATWHNYRSSVDAASLATRGLLANFNTAGDRAVAYAGTINRVTGAESAYTRQATVAIDRTRALKTFMDALHSKVIDLQFNIHTRGQLPGGGDVRFARGGPITEPIVGVGQRTGTRYTFGEEGPEDVVPRGGGHRSSGAVSGGSVSGLSADDIARALWPMIRALASRPISVQVNRREIALAVSDQGLAER